VGFEPQTQTQTIARSYSHSYIHTHSERAHIGQILKGKRKDGITMSLADKVINYFVALIVGVILLYVLYQVIVALAADLPVFLRYAIPIFAAAAGALLVLAKRGIK